MNIQEVEALSVEELKTQREALPDALEAEPKAMAVRYIKQLILAKMRDEKLGEQGRLITSLQDGLDAAKAQVVTVRQEADEWKKVAKEAASDIAVCETIQREREEAIKGLKQRCERLKVQAETYAIAMSTCYKVAADAMARHEIEKADTGE